MEIISTREEIIDGLNRCDRADEARLDKRLSTCNVRIVYTDGTIQPIFDIRTCLGAAQAMMGDPRIRGIEYDFNNIWTLAYETPARQGRPTEMIAGRRVNVYLDAASLARAAELGDGNVSEGIRSALRG